MARGPVEQEFEIPPSTTSSSLVSAWATDTEAPINQVNAPRPPIQLLKERRKCRQCSSSPSLYVGVVIGAGLASGQDLLQYSLSARRAWIGIAVLGILNIVFGVVALQLGSYYRSGHHDEVFERIALPLVRLTIDIIPFLRASAMGVVMFRRGSEPNAKFGIPAWAGSDLQF